jgi:NAD(P)H-hydrate epimerase
MKVFTAAQMRAFDKAATEEYKIPSIVLMENAALRVVEFLEMKFAPLCEKRIVVLCGKGNNGGDGFAIARHLLVGECKVWVAPLCLPNEIKGDAKTNFEIISGSITTTQDTEILDFIPEIDLEEVFPATGFSDNRFDIIIDCILGTGFRGDLSKPELRNALYFVNTDSGKKVSVDIPSALNSDSGEAAPQAAQADYTVTFAAPKRGMFVRDGIEKCGEIWVGDIGTPPSLMEEIQTGCECITREIAQNLLPRRTKEAHKGNAGRVVLIGGSVGMSGAPTMAAKAVLKSGAGLCIAALPEKILPTFASAFPEATSHPLPCSAAGVLQESAADELSELWKNADVVAIGPGLGRDGSTLDFVRRAVRECPQPLVVDADALYALREIEDDLQKRKAPTILTPHPGEMGELMEMKTSEVNENRIETALACAQKFDAIVVLKGARSIVALPDGNTHINLTGNSGMATGGAGDVLTGTIAGLLAQTKNAANATLLGVYAHGLAGDFAFEASGNGLIAGDIADHLPRALLEIAKPIEPPINSRLRKLE